MLTSHKEVTDSGMGPGGPPSKVYSDPRPECFQNSEVLPGYNSENKLPSQQAGQATPEKLQSQPSLKLN